MGQIITSELVSANAAERVKNQCSIIEEHIRKAKRQRSTALFKIILTEFRYLCAKFSVPHWCASLVAGSLLAILSSACVIVLHLDSPILILCCCALGYVVGGGCVLFMLQDSPIETEENRVQIRQKLLWEAQESWREANSHIAEFKSEKSSLNAELKRCLRDDRLRQLNAAQQAKREAESRASEANAALVEARKELESLQTQTEAAVDRLLSVDPGRLYPDELENFVAEVFQHLGYSVTETGQSGDKGVDVVATRPGRKLAIQVKRYGSAVGLSAVQEVFAGMMHYGCNGCVVVTSNYFTPAAVELAGSTGCVLIDRDAITPLIRGELRI